MRKQTQFNGLWQSTTTGVIRYADTEHGVLWERTLEDTREVWRQLDVSKSHLRGYLAALMCRCCRCSVMCRRPGRRWKSSRCRMRRRGWREYNREQLDLFCDAVGFPMLVVC